MRVPKEPEIHREPEWWDWGQKMLGERVAEESPEMCSQQPVKKC